MLTSRPISPQSLGYYDIVIDGGVEMGPGYYEGESKQKGIWFGSGRHALGLDGEIDSREFRNVFQGYTPSRTVALVQNAGRTEGERARRPGFDFTFSAPKDFSLLHAATTSKAEQDLLLGCHDDAVVFVLDLLEAPLAKTRLGKAGKHLVKSKGLLGARFLHHSSRENDPQVHTHALVSNLAQGPDGKWRALASTHAFTPGLMKKYGTLYREILASNLERVFDLRVTMAFGYVRIPGIPAETRAYYSKRRAQIEAVGYRDAQESGQVALHTRKPKDKSIELGQLADTWRQELAKTFGPEFTVKKLRAHQRSPHLEHAYRATLGTAPSRNVQPARPVGPTPQRSRRVTTSLPRPATPSAPSDRKQKRTPATPAKRRSARARIQAAFPERPSLVVTWLETAIRGLNHLERIRVRHIARTTGEMGLGSTSLSEIGALATIYRESGMRFLALTRSTAEATALSKQGPHAISAFALLQIVDGSVASSVAHNLSWRGLGQAIKAGLPNRHGSLLDRKTVLLIDERSLSSKDLERLQMLAADAGTRTLMARLPRQAESQDLTLHASRRLQNTSWHELEPATAQHQTQRI